MSDLMASEEHHQLRARDFLSEEQCKALALALLQTCLDEGIDPNVGASAAQQEAALDWAADIVFQHHALLEVIGRQGGIAALRGKRHGKYRIALLRPIIDSVIANAMTGGIAASARTK